MAIFFDAAKEKYELAEIDSRVVLFTNTRLDIAYQTGFSAMMYGVQIIWTAVWQKLSLMLSLITGEPFCAMRHFRWMSTKATIHMTRAYWTEI